MDCRLSLHLPHSSVSPSNNSMARLFQFTLLGPTPQFYKAKTSVFVPTDLV